MLFCHLFFSIPIFTFFGGILSFCSFWISLSSLYSSKSCNIYFIINYNFSSPSYLLFHLNLFFVTIFCFSLFLHFFLFATWHINWSSLFFFLLFNLTIHLFFPFLVNYFTFHSSCFVLYINTLLSDSTLAVILTFLFSQLVCYCSSFLLCMCVYVSVNFFCCFSDIIPKVFLIIVCHLPSYLFLCVCVIMYLILSPAHSLFWIVLNFVVPLLDCYLLFFHCLSLFHFPVLVVVHLFILHVIHIGIILFIISLLCMCDDVLWMIKHVNIK